MSHAPEAPTLVETLRGRATRTPARPAFEFEQPDGQVRTMDYAELDRGAMAVAAHLRAHADAGARVLIAHPPGPDYVIAFFGALYSGAVAVPVYPPASGRGLDRLDAIAEDAGAALALSDAATVASVLDGPWRGGAWRGVRWVATDDLEPAGPEHPPDRAPDRDELAFLQYTSGSTSSPKGVMVSHGNLAHNAATIAAALDLDETSRSVSWLPPYHDMGLIGGILQPVHTGFPATLLTPLTFLRHPLRWLAALSRTRATTTAAPDFAYAEVVRRTTPAQRNELDLSTLRHALVGSEPVRPTTLTAFAEAFQHTGFHKKAFYPCYGLAEATLFVTGGTPTGTGPTTLTVTRPGLAAGQAVIAQPGADQTTALTGCGHTHGNTMILVVDPESGQPLPPDTVGEILVSGPTVTSGYWRRPDLTEATFRSCVDGQPGRTFLRTGDLGFRHGADLFITGRAKDLIVARGRNHHPADLEQTSEEAHPLLFPFRGAAFGVDDGSVERIVLAHEVRAGFRAAEHGPAVVAAVRAAVAAEHGVFLDEVVLVRTGSIPRTSSGKVRRAECRRRWADGELAVLHTSGRPAVEPTDDDQEDTAELTRLVAAVLDVPPAAVAPDISLVAQGLDSLRAVRLSVALEEWRGARVPIADLLDGMTPRRLAEHPVAAPHPDPPALPPETTATAAQQRMWLLDRMGAGAAYRIACGLHLTGPLDAGLLARCVAGVLAEYPALDSVFAPDEDGTLRVSPGAAVPLPVLDLTGAPDRDTRLDAELRQLAAAPLDLASGPSLRLLLVRLAPDRWCLGLVAHHILLDGWSMGILLRRLGETYRAAATGAPLPPPSPAASPRTPGDDELRAAAEFWRARLAGARPVALPVDRPHRTAPTWRGGSLPVELSPELVGRVRALAAARGVTPFTVLLTAFGVLLGRWADQDDLVLGTVVAGRDRPGAANRVGMLADVLPVRVALDAAPDLAALVDRVHAACLDAYRHSALPFDAIARAAGARADGGRHPLVRALLVLQNLPVEPWEAGAVRAEPFELPTPGAQYELSLHLTPRADGAIAGHASYAADLFDAGTVGHVLAGLPVLLDAATRRPATPVTELPLLPPAAAEEIVRSRSDGGPPVLADGLVHELVAAAAAAHPDVAAVVWDDGTLTYRELRARIVETAARLRADGAEPDRPVALCLERSAELVVAVCAVLAAGSAYLPLDPTHPPARLVAQVRDSGAGLVVADERTRPAFADLAGDVLVLSTDRPATPDGPQWTSSAVHHDQLANILYTSGSTGAPKAVMTTHAALANRLAWMQRAYGLRPGEAVLHKTPVSFDVAGWELLWPLTVGATVVLARPGGHRDPRYLAGLITRQRVTTCHFVPAMLLAFLTEPAAATCAGVLRRVVCSGEELTPALAALCHRVLAGVALHNLYGPTEAAIDVTAHPVTPTAGNGERVPIGRAIPGTAVYVLDRSGRPAPPLAPGELHIGGLAPARGYLGRPGLTADRFVPDPFRRGGRLYRTGDRGRMRPDGTLEFLGRVDRQLKIRGQRVEPGEIEAVLTRHDRVAAAVVQPRPGPTGEPRLVAWVAPAGTRPALADLRRFLLEHLPAAMVPELVCVLPELPVGAHGKLDRSALPAPGVGGGWLQPRDGDRVAPRDPVERTLASIWRDVLGCAEPSVTDDFYELGGHSLLATRLVVRMRAAFGVDVPISAMIGDGVTIARLAALVRSRQLAAPEVDEVLRWLGTLSDDEVAALLPDEADRADPPD